MGSSNKKKKEKKKDFNVCQFSFIHCIVWGPLLLLAQPLALSDVMPPLSDTFTNNI